MYAENASALLGKAQGNNNDTAEPRSRIDFGQVFEDVGVVEVMASVLLGVIRGGYAEAEKVKLNTKELHSKLQVSSRSSVS